MSTPPETAELTAQQEAELDRLIEAHDVAAQDIPMAYERGTTERAVAAEVALKSAAKNLRAWVLAKIDLGPRLTKGDDLHQPMSWTDFQTSGMLWAVNRWLHMFGLVIVLEFDDETGEFICARPARTSWRGFPPESEERGFARVAAWIRENAGDL